jgi:hypothetical protein
MNVPEEDMLFLSGGSNRKEHIDGECAWDGEATADTGTYEAWVE